MALGTTAATHIETGTMVALHGPMQHGTHYDPCGLGPKHDLADKGARTLLSAKHGP